MSRTPRRAPRGFSVAGAIGAALLVAGGVEIAAAESGGEPIRLEYRAGPGCPDEGAFVARIRARTARARLVREGERARTFTVDLTAGAHPSGSVTVRDGLRSGGTRRIDADTCNDVADALALMVALALDPHAQGGSTPPSDSVPPPVLDSTPVLDSEPLPDAGPALDSGTEPSADLSPDSSTPDSPAPPPLGPQLPPSSEAEEAPNAVSAPRPSPLARHLFGGVDLALATDVTPTTLFAGAPYVGWRGTRAALVGPSFRAAFLRAGTGILASGGGSATFTWTVGRLDACAMLWPDRALRIGGCARAEGGVLDVRGERVLDPRTEHTPWFALGPLARLEWSFLGPLLLDVGAGPAFHITAKRFLFIPGTLVYEVPVVGFAAEAGLGVHFL